MSLLLEVVPKGCLHWKCHKLALLNGIDQFVEGTSIKNVKIYLLSTVSVYSLMLIASNMDSNL